MMPRFSPVRCSFFAAFALASQFVAAVASAHISLEEPLPRYPNAISGENKACPCGVGERGNNRSCSIESDRSDPDRSTDRVTTVTAGSTVVFRFDEYVAHSGRYRIAFDDNGADLEDFNKHILADIPDPPGNVGNVDEDSIWEIPVMIPSEPCTNCTLQLIQMMDGNMTAPVLDPVGRSSYYQCADIVIVRAGGTTGGGQGGSASTGAEAGAAGSADPASDDSDDESADADDTGCSIGRSEAASGWSALGVLSVLWLSRRRRRSVPSRAHGSES